MQDFIQKIILALIAGFSEFLPVSAPAHQILYQYISNQTIEPLLLLAVHIGCLTACVICCRKRMKRLRNERKLMARMRKGRGRQADPAALMDTAIIRTASAPIFFGYLFYRSAVNWIDSIAILALVLLINGILLFIPRLLVRGNKDGRSLSRLDGLLMGMGGMLGVLPGFSRLGCVYSVGIARGADQNYMVETALTLSIPAFVVMICFDIYAVAIAGAAMTAMLFFSCFIAAVLAFASGYLTIAIFRYFSGKTDVVNFSYYSWGLALFAFLIYLIVH